jgi:hypothetical protein
MKTETYQLIIDELKRDLLEQEELCIKHGTERDDTKRLLRMMQSRVNGEELNEEFVGLGIQDGILKFLTTNPNKFYTSLEIVEALDAFGVKSLSYSSLVRTKLRPDSIRTALCVLHKAKKIIKKRIPVKREATRKGESRMAYGCVQNSPKE